MMNTGAADGIPEGIRVLLVDLSKRFGGASVRTLSLARHLAPWQTAVVGLKDSPVVKIARERNIAVRIVGSSRLDPLIPIRLSKIIRVENFQVVDTQNIQSKFWTSLAVLLADFAFVSTLNSSYRDEHAGSWKGTMYSAIDHWTSFKTDRHIAVSRSIMDGLLQSGISADLIDLVTNAVEVNDNLPPVNRREILQKVGVPEDAMLCVSVGRLVWAKGYEDLIDAFALIADQVPNAYSVILGDGELFEKLSEQIRRAGLDGRILLLGHCSHEVVVDVLSAGGIFVMPSRSEGVPYALLEAAALGLPILATRCGGIPEILADQKDAILVPVGNHVSLSAGLIKLLTDRSLSRQLGANARATVRMRFSLPAQIESTRRAYLKAMDHNRQMHTQSEH